MYCLYLDDSGSMLNKNEQFFVLGGVVVPEEKHYWVNKHLDELASEIDRNDPLSVEFHASEIFSGRKEHWKAIADKTQRISIINQVLNVASREKLCTIACAVEKRFYAENDVVRLAFEDVISRFQSFLSHTHRETKTNVRGMIIFDKSAFEKDIQKLALHFRDRGTRYRQISGVQEVPLFVDSRASRAIQLADHVAYSVFRRFNASDLFYFNRIQSQFEMCGTPHLPKDYGLFHMTRDFRSCTCPACLCIKYSSQAIELPLPIDGAS
jgi:hypothetical protein